MKISALTLGGFKGIAQTAHIPLAPITLLFGQGEIVNILLKIKNSFLPTKQILIGL